MIESSTNIAAKSIGMKASTRPFWIRDSGPAG
jgi:hypothetical protein